MQEKPVISILHPSFKRPELAMKCYEEWISNTSNTDSIEYVLCLSRKDPRLMDYMEIFRNTKALRFIIEDNGWVTQLNAAAKESQGNLLVCIGDDFGCFKDWDYWLLELLKDKKDFVIKTQDGQQPWIITLPIMDREYYNRFGYVVYPEYKHMFGDTELTHVADLIGKTINIPLLFPHNHYTTGKNQKDSVNIQNDLTWSQGESLYLSRMKSNFGLETIKEIKLPQHHIQWLRTKGIVIQ